MDSNTVAAIFLNIIFLALFAAFVFGKNETEQNLRLKLENRLFNLEKAMRKLEGLQESIEADVEIKIDARIAQTASGQEMVKSSQRELRQITDRVTRSDEKLSMIQKQLIDKKILISEVKSLYVN
jgi:hypothetical protein